MSSRASSEPSEDVNFASAHSNDGRSDASDDDDIVTNNRRTVERHNEVDDEDDDLDDDLFGDGGDDDALDDEPSKHRDLDDEELDSGDDEGRHDRTMHDDAANDQNQEQEFSFLDVEFARHAVPEPSDNELYLLKVPQFLSIEPASFHHKNFQPPTTDHHSKEAPSSTFSAYNTALTMLRWRHSPSDPQELQSNARILRWSDGSLTLQFASDATTQYEIDGKPLAPPQRNPSKPTPTSFQDRKNRSGPAPAYNPNQDSFTYLVAPHEFAGLFRITNKITTGLSINPSAETTDSALEQLQNALATAAARGRDPNSDGKLQVIEISEDPEEARRKAEAAERQKLKQQRAREKNDMRERERASRVFGRHGGRPGGLTVGGLEDDDGLGRPRVSRPKPKRQRRGEIYSDDEEDFDRRHTKEDEYDEEDDFIAGSEEEEIVEDDDEEEDFDDIAEAPRHRRRDSPKRDADGDDDEDDDGDVITVGRAKRRRVVEDDDDDE